MSFGFSASDLVFCVRLAHHLWRDAKDAPNDFQNVSMEVASFKLVLEEVQESISGRVLDHSKRAALAELIKGCNGVLIDLRNLLDKYKSLATQSKRTWDRLRWGKEPIEAIRARLVSHTSLLTSFRSGLLGGSLARIEELLEQLALERRTGLRETSLISTWSGNADSEFYYSTIDSAEEGDEAIWSPIARELEDVGITPSMVAKHKEYIIDWIKRALLDGRFDEAAPVPHDTTNPERQDGEPVCEDTLSQIALATGLSCIYRGLPLLEDVLSLDCPRKFAKQLGIQDYTIQLMLLGDQPGLEDTAKGYQQTNTDFPITALSPFATSVFDTLNGISAQTFLAYPKHQIRNIHSGRLLSLGTCQNGNGTHPFLTAKDAKVAPCWRIAKRPNGRYQLVPYTSGTQNHLSAIFRADSGDAPKVLPSGEKPWWMFHDWSLDSLGQASSLFKIRVHSLNLALDMTPDGALHLTYERTCASQLWSFIPAGTATMIWYPRRI